MEPDSARAAAAKKQRDLMESVPVRPLLWKLAIPSIAAQIVNLLYNIVDRIYIGHIPGIGAAALTGVGLIAPLMMLVNAFAMLVGTGGAPRASISMGQHDYHKAERILGNCAALVIVISVVLTPILFAAAPPLLRFFGASASTLPYALSYGRIYLLGTIFIMTTMALNLFISAQGYTRFSMMTTVIGAVLNIILDPILIFGFKMGVRGAAVATVISQAVSALWIFFFLRGKKTQLKIRKENIHPNIHLILPILGLGLSTFVMSATESLLSICFNHNLAAYGGDLAVGAMTIITSFVTLVSMPLSGLYQGGQPIVSYNYGAGRHDRVKAVIKQMLIISICYTVLFWAVIQLAPTALVRIFTNDPALIKEAIPAMHVYFAVIFTVAFQNTCQQSFVALSQAPISLFLACLRKLILLIPLIFILPHFFTDKVFAVFLAEPISDSLAAIVTTYMFYRRSKKILN